MKLKKIGISLRVEFIEKYNEKRDTISHDWINFLQKMNCIPLLIPNNIQNLEDYITNMDLDGVILSGGDNIGDFPERDRTEDEILKFVIKNKIPTLGVCRGMQIMNNFFAGEIRKNATSKHVGKSHNIDIINNDVINVLENSKINVNSFHNNLIMKEDIGEELEIFALDENDHSVEGYLHRKFPIMGVMWHPERNLDISYQEKLIRFLLNKKIR
tara:strand:+ start:186 stop:827 length:642 start_codon:yes stop_codon:yes gene_type:complete